MLTLVYFWIIAYAIGMVVVGFPIGYLSLKAWKHPEKKFLGFWFFPLRTMIGREWGQVGKRATDEDSSLIDEFDFDFSDECLATQWQVEMRAKYVAITMVIWPLRVLNILCAMPTAIISLFFLGIMNVHVPIMRCLLVCKRCLRV